MAATLPATVIPQTTAQREARRWDLVARARLLGWGGQNGIARRLDVDRGHFSRVMKGERQSDSLWARAERAIAQAERRRKRKRGA